MADIKVVIQLQDTIEDEINSLESPTDVSNASINKTGEQFNTLSTKSAGANLKSWATGSLSLADGYVGGANTQLIEQYGYNGYVFGAVPESKQLTVTLEVVGKYIDSIIVYGDRTANQFPTKAYRDGNPNDIIYSDDPVWAIKFSEPSTSHTITFLEWNREDYNACITYIAELKNELVIDKSMLKSVESLSQYTGQPKGVYYGVVPNRGHLELLDVDGEMYDYINEGIIKRSNVQMKIKANGKNVQEHISTDSDYANRILSVELSDFLNDFDKIYYKGFAYSESSASLHDIIIDAQNSLPSMYKNKIVLSEDFVNKTSAIIYTTPFVPYMTYKSFLNKVCEVTQTQFIQKDDGNFTFVDATHTFNDISSVIVVPSKVISANSSSKDTLLKNKVKRVEYRDSTFVRDTNKAIESLTIDSTPNKNRLVTNKQADYNYYNNSVTGVRYMQGARIENVIYNGSFNIPKSVSIEKLNSASISIDIGKKIDNSTATVQTISPSLYDLSDVTTQESLWRDFDRAFSGNYIFWGASSIPTNTNPLSDISLTYTDIVDTNSKTLSLTHNNFANIIENEDSYTITYSVNVFTAKYYLESVGGEYGNANCEINYVERFTISVKGVSSTLEFTADINKIGDAESIDYISLPDNELSQKGLNIYESVANNILEEYNNGLSTAKVTVCCIDLYNINGDLAKDWSVGDIIEVGDILRVDKDNDGNSMWRYANGEPMYWRVTSRNFRKVGVPMLDLELQEVKQVV